MNWILTWIVPPIVGAVIGYCTNWLAIKMLFKPYNEVRIGGIKVPFTPGLIPKERNRIASKIAEAIGNYLLNDDIIIKKLKSDRIKNEIRTFMSMWICRFKEGITINQLATNIFDEDKEYIVNELTNKIALYVTNEYLDEVNKSKVHDIIYSQLNSTLKKDVTIAELLGNDNIESIKVFITGQTPVLLESAKRILTDEDIENKIKKMISDVISEKFGALGAMFVDTNSLYGMLLEKVINLLDEEDIMDKVGQGLEQMLNNAISKEIGDILSEDKYEQILEKLTFTIQSKMYTNDSISSINNIVKMQIEKVMDEVIIIPEEITNKIQERIIIQYDKIIDNRMQDILKTIKLSEIMEEQINAFDIEELEEMILSIVNKELKAITWFGALLGFVMGLVLLVA